MSQTTTNYRSARNQPEKKHADGYRFRRNISAEEVKSAIILDLRRGWLGPDNPYVAAMDYYEVRFGCDGSCDVYESIED